MTTRYHWVRLPIGTAMGLAIVLGAALAASAASARQVAFPEAKPTVTMSVPDGWGVTYTDLGVEMISPEKDSIVVASILKHDMSSVDGWKSKVLTRMEAAGVTVDTAAAAAPVPAPAAKPAAAMPSNPTDQLPGTTAKPSFAFAGAPTLDTPSLGPVSNTVSTPGSTPPAEPATPGHKGGPVINGLHVQSYRLLGGRFRNQPTDMQLVLYAIPGDKYFAVEQQSTSEDNRAAAILNSVKRSPR